jgi:hypothetical protein
MDYAPDPVDRLTPRESTLTLRTLEAWLSESTCADAFIRSPSSERTKRDRIAQLGDGRDVMFVGIPRLLRQEIRRTPREPDFVGRRSTR